MKHFLNSVGDFKRIPYCDLQRFISISLIFAFLYNSFQKTRTTKQKQTRLNEDITNQFRFSFSKAITLMEWGVLHIIYRTIQDYFSWFQVHNV